MCTGKLNDEQNSKIKVSYLLIYWCNSPGSLVSTTFYGKLITRHTFSNYFAMWCETYKLRHIVVSHLKELEMSQIPTVENVDKLHAITKGNIGLEKSLKWWKLCNVVSIKIYSMYAFLYCYNNCFNSMRMLDGFNNPYKLGLDTWPTRIKNVLEGFHVHMYLSIAIFYNNYFNSMRF